MDCIGCVLNLEDKYVILEIKIKIQNFIFCVSMLNFKNSVMWYSFMVFFVLVMFGFFATRVCILLRFFIEGLECKIERFIILVYIQCNIIFVYFFGIMDLFNIIFVGVFKVRFVIFLLVRIFFCNKFRKNGDRVEIIVL